jgi:cell wall-associated NlpC family hydrolase
MSRIQRALLVATLSAVSLSTLTLPVPTFAAGPVTAAPTEYVVKAGDFLAGIAAKVGVALPALLTANHFTKTSLILPGDKLIVPAGAAAPTAIPAAAAAPAVAPAATPIVYTVKAGDFLAAIARSYKVALPDLLATNKFTAKSLITPGMQVTLPANAVDPQAVQPAPAPAAAATPAVAAAPAAPTSSSLTYTVKSGDFLAGIAAKYSVKLTDLLATNKLKATSLILPGATLAMPAGAVQPSVTAAVVASTGGPADVVVAYASAQLGKPYRFDTAGPDTFDCSGLAMAAYHQIGIDLPHYSAAQAGFGTPVDFLNQPIKAGDLVFLATRSSSPVISHVGIAVDATHWIHAPKPGDVVRMAPIPANGVLAAVRRLIP